METIDFAKVGLKMKELRCALGIQQQQVANDIGTTVAFISNIENNKVKINLRMLLYYSEMCDVPIDVLLDAGRTHKKYTECASVDAQITSILQDFSPDEKDTLFRILQLIKNKQS
ncbi:MAG: helix-turn-helix transcriptional regulator [Eubacteriales bacterium]|nr:helix-turn-helix transcriptional regulator [Lachnospiraceae bacterium]MDO5126784.1 helix-turn-helix transcriptional regulator [Eubacteriales bacterium]